VGNGTRDAKPAFDLKQSPILARPARPMPRDMFFQHYGVNPTIDARTDNTSTFSVDVDTASYSIIRNLLNRGILPDPAAVRVEEFVNAFDYQYPPPGDEVLSLQAEAFPSPNRQGYHLLHLGIKARDVSRQSRKPANLVFVVDVSGSMKKERRLDTVKNALSLLVDQLNADDYVAIVAYNDHAHTILPPTSGYHRRAILAAIQRLHSGGSTNVEDGLDLGYDLANKYFAPGIINRLILCSDGVANVGNRDATAILETVGQRADDGITLTAVGVGMGNYNDVLLEQLAQHGNGNYAYIDTPEEAEKLFVDKLTSTLEVVAKDTKVQVEFDPVVIQRYRQLGYENRAMSDAAFLDGRRDAGEMGAGHSVTALYEVKFREPVAASQNFGMFRVSYKLPNGQQVRVLEHPLPRQIIRHSYAEAASPTQLSLVAAAFAEKLRGAYWSRYYSYNDLLNLSWQLRSAFAANPEVQELHALIERASSLDQRADRFEHDMPLAQSSFDRVPVLR
ncbi:MAG: von Willebrand factor type A domain-containing protein, partial [Pseudomonadota bacterium]